jgi:signal transduction histidine kinase
VHRHASASRVAIRLKIGADRFHLAIIDDGHGCPGGSEPLPSGVGVAGMTARARQLGGALDIRSRPTGTAVHVVVPILNGAATSLPPHLRDADGHLTASAIKLGNQ